LAANRIGGHPMNSDATNALTVKMPGHSLAAHTIACMADTKGFQANIEPVDRFGIVSLLADGLRVSWSTEQWAAIIPALVAQLPAEQQVQVIEAIRGAGVAQ
jgi:hypothetical protein